MILRLFKDLIHYSKWILIGFLTFALFLGLVAELMGVETDVSTFTIDAKCIYREVDEFWLGDAYYICFLTSNGTFYEGRSEKVYDATTIGQEYTILVKRFANGDCLVSDVINP